MAGQDQDKTARLLSLRTKARELVSKLDSMIDTIEKGGDFDRAAGASPYVSQREDERTYLQHAVDASKEVFDELHKLERST